MPQGSATATKRQTIGQCLKTLAGSRNWRTGQIFDFFVCLLNYEHAWFGLNSSCSTRNLKIVSSEEFKLNKHSPFLRPMLLNSSLILRHLMLKSTLTPIFFGIINLLNPPQLSLTPLSYSHPSDHIWRSIGVSANISRRLFSITAEFGETGSKNVENLPT